MMPAFVPKELKALEGLEEGELFKKLVDNPPQLIAFLMAACEDETWSGNHSTFMRQAFNWVTEQVYQDRLLSDFIKDIAHVVKEHYGALQSFLPLNLTFKLKDGEVGINGLLYCGSSDTVRELLRRECRDKKKFEIHLPKTPLAIFTPIDEYITTSSTFELYRKTKDELIKILNLAMKWDLKELSLICQMDLKKYVTRENMFEMLLKSHEKNREVLKQQIIDVINSYKLGCRLESRGEGTLGFEFLEFTENSLSAFNEVKEEVTHLICRDKTTLEEEFPKVLHACPKLICLDIGHSAEFSNHLKEIPSELFELEAPACMWMNDKNLLTLVELCPQLTRLSLGSDVSITFEGWGALKKLEHLRNLDLTRSLQIGDGEVSIILQATPELIILSFEECRSISDAGFADIPQYNVNFTQLNLARTPISDVPLVDIATKCESLISLNLTHCDNLTDVAILEVVRSAKKLSYLNIKSCDINILTITKIKQIKPYLELIY